MLCTSVDFKSAMRLFPASVAVIATGIAPNRFGMTATAVCSLSAEPPQVLVCLNARTATSEAIRRNGTFSMNLLADVQAGTARRFAGMDGVTGDDKFDPGDWKTGDLGVPVLTTGLQSFACRVVSAHKEGTHFIVVGRVEEMQINERDQALMYRDGAFGIFSPALSGPEESRV
jgi:flavin reductase (DIM6/NTAB) family NADH-FMN oxidoreductase RutF